MITRKSSDQAKNQQEKDLSEIQIETHPLDPFLPSNALLLMLGSFPPPKIRWSMDFYYPNLNNDMWRIYGQLFYDDKNYFLCKTIKKFDKEKITDFLSEKGIAIFDCAKSIRRLKHNASDNSLEIVEKVDVKELLKRIPQCKAISTTGLKATETTCCILGLKAIPQIGEYLEFSFENRNLRLYRMPSSSRAYPINIDRKAATYRIMFQDLKML